MLLRPTLSLAALLLAGNVLAAEPLKSGPPVGAGIRGAFFPLHVTGPDAGTRQCPVWRRNTDLVALIFVREVSDPLTGLVKKIDDKLDEAAGKRAGGWALGAYVIFCNDSAGLDERLRKVARKEAFKRVALCIDTPAGPVRYEVAKDAEVTVVIYQKRRVVANFALKKGELDEAKGKDIVEALAKALP